MYRIARSYLGSLWIALDTRSGEPGTPVLIRHLPLPDSAPVEALQRVACAGRDAMALNHENVLSVVGVFQGQQSLAVAHAYVHAEPLRSLQSWVTLRGAHFPVDVSLRIVVDLLRGVKALHGALHGWPSAPPFGGISPDSVLLSRDGRTRLCDPLISSCAALLEGFGFSDSKLAYAAPEQVHATAPLGAASDVFTCAAILWELLTGRRLISGSRAVIERKLLEHALPRLSDNLRRGSDVSPGLIELVERSLSADASKRPQTPAALAAELEQCGHELATPAQVARFVKDICAPYFERRSAEIRMKVAPELQARLESFDDAPVAGGRKSLRPLGSSPGFRLSTTAGKPAAAPAPVAPSVPAAAPAAPAAPAPAATAAAAPAAPRGPATRRIPLPARSSAATGVVPRAPRWGAATSPRREPAPPAEAPEARIDEPAPMQAPVAAAPAECSPSSGGLQPLEPETRVVTEDAASATTPESDRDEWLVQESKPTADRPPTPPPAPAPMPALRRSEPPDSDGWQWPEPEPVSALPVPEPEPVAAPPVPVSAALAATPGPARPRVAFPAPRPGPKRGGAAAGDRTIMGLGAMDLGALVAPGPGAPTERTLPPPDPRRAAGAPDPAPAPDDTATARETELLELDVVQEADEEDHAVTQHDRVAYSVPLEEEIVQRVASSFRNPSGWSHAPKLRASRRGRAVLVATLATLVLGIAVAVAVSLRSAQGGGSALAVAPAPASTSDVARAAPPAEPAAQHEAPAPKSDAPTTTKPDARDDAGVGAEPALDAPAEAQHAIPADPASEFAAAELSDEQLTRLFALESRAELPSCAKRLGASARAHKGKDAVRSQSQLKAARKALVRGESDKAMQLLCSATAHSAANTAAWQLLAELSLQLGDAAQAKQAIERALKRKPADPTLLGIQGDVWALLGNLTRSRELWTRSAKVAGSGAERTRRLAALFGSIGDKKLKARSHGGALTYYRRAAVLSAGGHGPSAAMREALRVLGQSRAALAWSDRLARAFPREARVRAAANTR